MENKFVTIIVPIKNEEKYIIQCLDSLLKQTFPQENYEILVIDGMSTDNTREIVNNYIQNNNNINIKMFDNPKKIAPTAMNIGLKNAKGDVIIRIDGHSYVSSDFIEQNLIALSNTDAACVGGPIEAIASDIISKAISFAMMSPFGVGNALFRYSKEPCYVDTLAFGAYIKDIFNRIGLFDEELVRNQDDELNYRLIKSGLKIFLTPKIKSYYYNRSSLKKLWSQYFQYGFWKVRVIQKHGRPASLRHLVPMTFILTLIFPIIISVFYTKIIWVTITILILYLLANLLFTFKICLVKGIQYLFLLPIVFAILHFSYGLGFISGLLYFYFVKPLLLYTK